MSYTERILRMFMLIAVGSAGMMAIFWVGANLRELDRLADGPCTVCDAG